MYYQVSSASTKININNSWMWWCMSLIPSLKRQRYAYFCEFEASLVYKMSSRTVRTVIQRKFVSKKQKKKKKEKEKKKFNF